MDDRTVKEEGGEVDIESGLLVTEDDSGNTKQEKTLFAKIYCGFVGDSIKDEDKNSVLYLKESNLSGVYMDNVKVTNKLLTGQDSVKSVENNLVKEKRKKSGNKKAAKPPRAPRGPSLDAADQKLIREITQLAMLKRARVERMKALKKMKAAKLSSSPSSSLFSMVFTVVFCIVILLQGNICLLVFIMLMYLFILTGYFRIVTLVLFLVTLTSGLSSVFPAMKLCFISI
jgi:hypothetical protein